MAVDSDGGEEDGISQRGLTVPGIRKSHKSKSTPDLFHHESSGSSVAGARKLEANKIRDEKNAAAPAKLELPPGLAKKLKAAFDQFDINKSGTIDRMELLGILQLFGQAVSSPEEEERLFAKIDTDGDGEIDFEEFIQLMRSKLGQRVVPGIIVKVIKATGLVARAKDQCDPAVVITLGKYSRFQSKFKRSTTEPRWDEDAFMPCPDPSPVPISIEIIGKNKTMRLNGRNTNEILGAAELDISNITEKKEQYKVLLYRVDEDVLGDMRGRGKAGTKELSKSLKSLPLVGGNADRNSTQQANEAGLEYRCGELYISICRFNEHRPIPVHGGDKKRDKDNFNVKGLKPNDGDEGDDLLLGSEDAIKFSEIERNLKLLVKGGSKKINSQKLWDELDPHGLGFTALYSMNKLVEKYFQAIASFSALLMAFKTFKTKTTSGPIKIDRRSWVTESDFVPLLCCLFWFKRFVKHYEDLATKAEDTDPEQTTGIQKNQPLSVKPKDTPMYIDERELRFIMRKSGLSGWLQEADSWYKLCIDRNSTPPRARIEDLCYLICNKVFFPELDTMDSLSTKVPKEKPKRSSSGTFKAKPLAPKGVPVEIVEVAPKETAEKMSGAVGRRSPQKKGSLKARH